MIFYSHSRIKPDGSVYGSKELTNHISGVVEIVKTLHSKNINFGYDNELLTKSITTVCQLHDLGKYTSFFQNYLLKQHPIDNNLKQHARIGGLTAYNILKNDDRKLALIVLYLIFRHHAQLSDIGTFTEVLNENLFRVIEKQVIDIEKNSIIIGGQLGIDALRDFLQFPDERELRKGFKVWARKEPDIKYYYLVNYLFSLLIEADKLDASDTRLYKIKPIDKNSVDNRFGTPVSENVDFAKLSNNQLRNFCRAEVVSQLNRTEILSHNLFTLTAPTGIGKTMTALDFALKLKDRIWEEEKINARIIYALPFINIIEQALKEYKTTLPPDVKVLGHYQFADAFGEDDESDNEAGSVKNYNQKLMSIDTWQSDIVITSFVQFFETLIGNRNKLLKKFSHCANAIIILDEVQTLRLDQMPLIGASLFFLSKYLNSKIILMTATKPKIFELAQREILMRENYDVQPLELLVSHSKVFSLFKRTAIVPKFDIAFEAENIEIDFVYKIFAEHWTSNKSCLIVCNTVNRSIAIYNAINDFLEENGYDNPVEYLSTNIIPAHRFERIEKVRNSIAEDKAPILISTQVVEAGVDLDFDMGFRDLGPIDSIIQVAGRINRNNNLEKSHSKLYIVDFGDAKKIYGQVTASQSKKVLQSKAEFPEEEYLGLVDRYFDDISERSSFSRFNKIFESMKCLRYDSNDPDIDMPISSFKIIEESKLTKAVFVETDDYAVKLRQSYLEKIQGIIPEEEFAKEFKNRFQQQIVAVPNYLTPHLDDINEYENKILVVPQELLNQYYSIDTGFIRTQTNSVTML